MNTKELHELLDWMEGQLDYINKVIKESHDCSNYGRETLFEGKRDAYLELIRKLKNHVPHTLSSVR